MLLETLLVLGDLRGAAREALREGSPVLAAWCLLEAGDTAEALEILGGLDEPDALLLRGEVFLKQLRASEAEEALRAARGPRRDSLLVLAYILNNKVPEAFALDSAFAARALTKFPPLYDENLAGRLSLLPGLGHFYVGEPLRGIWSGALVGGILGYMIYAVSEKHYVDFVLFWQFLFNRFYAGASANARATAKDKNRWALRRWLEEFL